MTSRSARLLAVAAVAVAAAWARQAAAWGDVGHQAVCEIAWLELSPAAREKVGGIMARERDERFHPFANACTWADDRKKVPGTIQNARRDEHFINLDRGVATLSRPDCGPARRCLFTAIRDDEAALRSTTGEQQLRALEFLGHWIGDLHQPLHVSYADDRGGNDIPVGAATDCSELHGLWDTCIPIAVGHRLGARPGPVDLGKRLQATITDAQRVAWRNGDPVAWAAESYAIARRADTRYCLQRDGRCCYDRHACEHDGGPPTTRLQELTHAYDEQQVATVADRLKAAGVRLALILETQLR